MPTPPVIAESELPGEPISISRYAELLTMLERPRRFDADVRRFLEQ